MTDKKFSVLLVEDDEYLQSIYASRFELAGCKVYKSKNGEEAIAIAKKEKPDIVLSDILMPKMDGFEMLKRLKQDKETKKIPVVLLSNLGQEDDVEKGKKMGAADYIIKVHHTPTEIYDRVAEIVKK